MAVIETDPGTFDRAIPGVMQRMGTKPNIVEMDDLKEFPGEYIGYDYYLYRAPLMPVEEYGPDGFIEYVDDIFSAAKNSLMTPNIETLVIDTASNLWLMAHHAAFEDVKKRNPNRSNLSQIEYAKSNSKMTELFTVSRYTNKNLVMLYNERPRAYYDEINKVTIHQTPFNWRHSDEVSDVIVNSWRKQDGEPPNLKYYWGVRIELSKVNPGSINQVMEKPTYADFHLGQIGNLL